MSDNGDTQRVEASGPAPSRDPDTAALVALLGAAGSGRETDIDLATSLPQLNFEDPGQIIELLKHMANDADTHKG